jgi:hypothetical protein
VSRDALACSRVRGFLGLGWGRRARMFGMLIFFMDGMAWMWALTWVGLDLENKKST